MNLPEDLKDWHAPEPLTVPLLMAALMIAGGLALVYFVALIVLALV